MLDSYALRLVTESQFAVLLWWSPQFRRFLVQGEDPTAALLECLGLSAELPLQLHREAKDEWAMVLPRPFVGPEPSVAPFPFPEGEPGLFPGWEDYRLRKLQEWTLVQTADQGVERRSSLLSDPQAFYQQVFGEPPSFPLRIIEEQEGSWDCVIPVSPFESDQVPLEELHTAAGDEYRFSESIALSVPGAQSLSTPVSS